ncbi:MAG: YdcF family protein [Flavobacteriales bacterium]|nr:YdcF family protein [Flavobacteriales bacterium]
MRLLRIRLPRRLVIGALLACGALLAVIAAADRAVSNGASAYMHDAIETVPANEVGLVLGTTHRGRGGGGNPYFNHRIAAATELYRSGKVSCLLVSGDNGMLSYNEPREMRRALMAAGIDSSRIVLDFAGFRTLDSVVRSREIFGQQRFTVISQRFHNERAVYLARRMGIEAVGYNAKDPGTLRGMRVWIRERLARVKVFVDLLAGTGPRYLGDRVPLEQPMISDSATVQANDSTVTLPPAR